MQQRARGDQFIEGTLVKGVCAPLLKCLSRTEGVELPNDIHAGHYSSHIGPRALASKAFGQGFFWPTAVRDAIEVAKTCEACQKISSKTIAPTQLSQLITPSWPLQK